MHLNQYDAAPYQEIILNACLHNITYDPQAEGFKTNYVMEIIDLTTTPDFYCERIREAAAQINDETDNLDACHLVELTRFLAKRGDAKARQILYDVFLQNLTDEDTLAASAIIEVDGAAGFDFVADKIGAIKRRETEHHVHISLVAFLEATLDESAAQNALATSRANNTNIDYYLNLVETQENRRQQFLNCQVSMAELSYEEVKHRIEHGISVNPAQWGRTATEQSLRQAAEDLLRQDDPKRILHYLKIFLKIPFPLNPQLLFRFMDVQHPYVSIPGITLSVLGNVQHSSVRNFGLHLIRKGRFSGRAVRLLTHNFDANDWALIENMSAQTLNDETYHDFTWSVQQIFEQHPDPLATKSLLNIYAHGPCSTCRERILLMLKSIDALSEQIREECLYDSNEVIRELARNDFEVSNID